VDLLGTKDGLNYHRKILEAIKAQDGPLAESLMEEHVERTIRRLKCMRGGDRKSSAGRKTDGKS
jgi:DNA-binding GntR family transcriptional regulator